MFNRFNLLCRQPFPLGDQAIVASDPVDETLIEESAGASAHAAQIIVPSAGTSRS